MSQAGDIPAVQATRKVTLRISFTASLPEATE